MKDEEYWYWVKSDKYEDEDWYPARRDAKSANGWTNDDTWEDFEGEINQFIKIPTPSECIKIEQKRKIKDGLNNLQDMGCY